LANRKLDPADYFRVARDPGTIAKVDLLEYAGKWTDDRFDLN
jgi:hypothetical protein